MMKMRSLFNSVGAFCLPSGRTSNLWRPAGCPCLQTNRSKIPSIISRKTILFGSTIFLAIASSIEVYNAETQLTNPPQSISNLLVNSNNTTTAAADGNVCCAEKVGIPLEIDGGEMGKLVLLGYGIRKVSWFGIGVYNVGIYVTEPGATLSSAIEDNITSFVSNSKGTAIAIVPTRGTQMAHLRDGLVRILVAAAELLNDDLNGVSSVDEEVVQEAVTKFRNFFPNVAVKNGQMLLLKRKKGDTLHLQFNGRDLGLLSSKWICDALFAAYLDEKQPISIAARESCLVGYKALKNRTVE